MNFLINWELIKVIQKKNNKKNKNKNSVDQKVIKNVQIRKMYYRLFTQKKKGNKNMLEIEFNRLSVHVWVKSHIK